MRPAVFLDRDGTLVEDPGFLRRPSDVRLLPGVAEAVRRLNAARRPVVVVTNQSGIGRGLITDDEYAAVERRVETLLAESGARIDASYHCPHSPAVSGPCECRKPGTKLYLEAARRFDLALHTCTWVGDRLTDLLPAQVFGGLGVLVRTGEGDREAAAAREQGFSVVRDFAAAVEKILKGED